MASLGWWKSKRRREEDAEDQGLIGDADNDGGVGKMTPLPWRQLAVVCLIRLAEPISFSVIYPFINEMIADLHVTSDPSQVGYFAGIIEGAFALSQFATVLAWGRASDRWGRRPVILIGLFGVILSTASFGFGRSVPYLIGARLINGVLNGNAAALKSFVGEITDDTNKALAFAVLPVCWAVGGVIGPILGGYLAKPAERIPSVFKGVRLFEEFPYALPCLVAASITFLGWIAGLLILEETLATKHPRSHPETLLEAEADVRQVESPILEAQSPSQRSNGYGTLVPPVSDAPRQNDETTEAESKTWSIRDIVQLRAVKEALMNYGALALIAVMHDAIWTLWLFTPIGKGGIGFSTRSIGTALSAYGVLCVAIPLIVFPPLQRRLGTIVMLRVTLSGYVLVALGAPIVTWVAISKTSQDRTGARHTDRPTLVWIGVLILVVLKSISNMAFSCTSLLVNGSPPDRNCLGSVNGLAQMTASSMRALGPAIAGSLFALSASHNWLGGEAAWYLLAAMGCAAVYLACHTAEEGKAKAQR